MGCPRCVRVKKYEQAHDGEWQQPVRRGYKMSCCDCGLVQIVDFRLFRGRIQFRASRDNRATAQVRRWKRAGVWYARDHTYGYS